MPLTLVRPNGTAEQATLDDEVEARLNELAAESGREAAKVARELLENFVFGENASAALPGASASDPVTPGEVVLPPGVDEAIAKLAEQAGRSFADTASAVLRKATLS